MYVLCTARNDYCGSVGVSQCKPEHIVQQSHSHTVIFALYICKIP